MTADRILALSRGGSATPDEVRRLAALALAESRRRRHRRNDLASMQLRAQAREINALRLQLARKGGAA